MTFMTEMSLFLPDYKGYFTLEIQHFAGGLPLDDNLRAQALKLSYDVARYLYDLN